MPNQNAIRFGAEGDTMCLMTEDDVLVSRMNLLIIMAKAYLKSYPMGEFRRKAIAENAEFVFHEALARIQPTRQELQQKDRLFLLRAQMLAVMVTSFVKKKSSGNFRRKAMADNIDFISEYLADGIRSGNSRILKVA